MRDILKAVLTTRTLNTNSQNDGLQPKSCSAISNYVLLKWFRMQLHHVFKDLSGGAFEHEHAHE